MEIRQLRHFVAAVEAGNLRKASERVHLTHPALSMSIKNLESDLGVELLIKNRHGVQLTFAGEKFLTFATALLRQVEDVRAQLHSSKEHPIGNVKLGMTVGTNNSLAAPLFKILLECYPDINLVIEEGNTASLERLYESDLLDVMIDYNTAAAIGQMHYPLYREHMYFVSAYDQRMDDAGDIELAQLARYPIVSSPGTHSMRRTLEKYAAENNINFNFLIDFQSAHASLKIVQEGLAYMVTPWDLIYDHVERKLVSARKIINPTIERTVCLVSSLKKTQSLATSAIINAIKSAVLEAHAKDRLRGELLIESIS